MTINTSEKEFENIIVNSLLQGGYILRTSNENYDKKRALDTELTLDFIKQTQKEQYEKLKQIKQDQTDNSILNELENRLEQNGMLYVIRKGISVSDVSFELFIPKPTSTLNEETITLYKKNILSVIRQLHYSSYNEKSLDIVLFLNGLPVATGEIKNPLTGQTFSDAILQYRNDRDPTEKLFEFKKRALVHFAIDSNEIHYTTKLNEKKTEFFPFNKGREYTIKDKTFTRAGNPDGDSFKTEYFWKEILQKDSWLDIIGNYIQLQSKEIKGAPTQERIIFPRYHQIDAVTKLTKETKLGSRYLIQHSTGGGKSNSIGWLAYKLYSLFDKTGEKPVFDSVLVISDRLTIVGQLGETIQQFEQTSGTFEEAKNVESLKRNLGNERKILVSTQQKFLNLLNTLEKRQGKNFAIILDEAHSSQSGESARKRDQALTEELNAKGAVFDDDDPQDALNNHILEKNKKHDQLSFYAFTATPKETTLHIFGNETRPKFFEPFHTYSMRQAIEEGFILDVLKNYTTYSQLFKLNQTAGYDKTVEGKKASRAIMKFVEAHELNISKKSQMIVEHFNAVTKDQIGGRAKAMVVAPSRLAAVKYKQEIDNYIDTKQYPGIHTLVAFSGEVEDNGKKFTEHSMNGKTMGDKEMRAEFDTPNFNILIVADKFQTGFDQPLLHTMYVDKKMFGIKPIQTLSRLNRATKGKVSTCVIDFRNSSVDIQAAFDPYYDGASLSDSTDVSYLDKLFRKIMNFEVITRKNLKEFGSHYFKSLTEQKEEDFGKVISIMDKVVSNYDELKIGEQEDFKKNLVNYVQVFRFLSNSIRLSEEEFHELYALILKLFIAKKFDDKENDSMIDVVGDDVELEFFKLKKTSEGAISLSGEGELVTGGNVRPPKRPDTPRSLAEVIQLINERNNTETTTADVKTANELEAKLDSSSEELQKYAKNSDADSIKSEYEMLVDGLVAQSYDTNPYFANKYFEDEKFRNDVLLEHLKVFQKRAKGEIPGIIFSPERSPEENLENLKNAISLVQGRLYYWDRYVTAQFIDLLNRCKFNENVKEIKILTSVFSKKITPELLQNFKNFAEKCSQNGIKCEMKVVLNKKFSNDHHQRNLLDDNNVLGGESIENISSTGDLHQIPEGDPLRINLSKFEEWWSNSEHLDIVKDWEKIPHPNDQGMYSAKCTDCKKSILVKFPPAIDKPVYCRDCLQNHKN